MPDPLATIRQAFQKILEQNLCNDDDHIVSHVIAVGGLAAVEEAELEHKRRVDEVESAWAAASEAEAVALDRAKAAEVKLEAVERLHKLAVNSGYDVIEALTTRAEEADAYAAILLRDLRQRTEVASEFKDRAEAAEAKLEEAERLLDEKLSVESADRWLAHRFNQVWDEKQTAEARVAELRVDNRRLAQEQERDHKRATAAEQALGTCEYALMTGGEENRLEALRVAGEVLGAQRQEEGAE